jgi:hypothetical protein
LVKLLTAIAVIAAVAWLCPRPDDRLPGFPPVFLWAWERPENLKFLNPQEAGVAFLSRTVNLQQGQVTVRPRWQPLRYAPGTVLISVVRVEAAEGPLPPVDEVAGAVVAGAIQGTRALQIDFDATLSQRGYYRELLANVRHRLPASIPLSMTALASWCEFDGWITGLPVVEAVPMLFRMGPGERPSRTFQTPLCRTSAGVSVDEPLREPPGAARLYVFNPRPWTEANYRTMRREVRRWH